VRLARQIACTVCISICARMQAQLATFPLSGNELSICQQCLERTVKDTVRLPYRMLARDAKGTTVL
jgi:hypothetical protein